MIKKNFKLFIQILIFLIIPFSSQSYENHILKIGDENAKVTVKVFSSLTCPHCASFHEKIFTKLKEEYIDKNKLKFEHHSFPLDLAALNAEKILSCAKSKNIAFEFLNEIYKKQNEWAVGSDINPINNSLIEIGLKLGLKKSSMDKCLLDEKIQEDILNGRIEAQKKYKITSTPTIYINEKKYKGPTDYKSFKKTIDKLL